MTLLGVFGWLPAAGCGTAVGGNRLANRAGIRCTDRRPPGSPRVLRLPTLTGARILQLTRAPAARVPASRCNPPIFSCLEISANAPSASGREGVSGWNILRSRKTVPPGATRFLQTAGCEACPLRPLLRLCGRASGFFFSGVQAVAFQVAVQAGSPNPQELRGS